MRDFDLPERPLEPKQPFEPHCPCCGDECETLYRDYLGRVIGCENCVEALDAYEYSHLAE